MPIADRKKVQTVVNLAGQLTERTRADLAVVVAKRDALVEAGASVAGTALETNVPAFNTYLADLEALLNSPVADAVVGAIVPSHRNDAI